MNKNYFEIKEKKQENKIYRVLLCDLLLFIDHCIRYNYKYDEFKHVYLELEKKIEDNDKIIKDLESDN